MTFRLADLALIRTFASRTATGRMRRFAAIILNVDHPSGTGLYRGIVRSRMRTGFVAGRVIFGA
jgi:hypothetical protein